MATKSKNKLASRKNTKPDRLKQAHPMEMAGWIDFKQLLGCALSLSVLLLHAEQTGRMGYSMTKNCQKKKGKKG